MTNHLHSLALVVCAGLATACGGSPGIEVKIDRSACKQTCSLELQLIAYRVEDLEPCLIKSRVVSLDQGQGTLDDLSLEESESIVLGALASCPGATHCPVCWASKTIQLKDGTEHQLSLKPTAMCTPGDLTLMEVSDTAAAIMCE